MSSEEASRQGCSSPGRRVASVMGGDMVICVGGADDSPTCQANEVMIPTSSPAIASVVPVTGSPVQFPTLNPAFFPSHPSVDCLFNKGGKGYCDKKRSRKWTKKFSKKRKKESSEDHYKKKFPKGSKVSKRQRRLQKNNF